MSGMIMAFYFLPLGAIWPQTGVQFVVGIGFGFLMVLSFSMFTDIAEYIDWRTGRQMTAMVVAASVFGVKAGVGIGNSLPGFVLGATGFVRDVEQSETAIMGIQLAFALIPAGVVIPAAGALLFYKITRKVIAEAEADLSNRRASSE